MAGFPRISFLLAILTLTACASGERRPAAVTEPAVPTDKVVIHELEPYLMEKNYPEHAFLMDPRGEVQLQTDYFSRFLKLTHANAKGPAPAPFFLDAILSCDQPFEFREDANHTSEPGPALVHFRIYDTFYKPRPVSLVPSLAVNECRLFLKLPDHPNVVYAVRLVTHAEDAQGPANP